MKYTLHLLHLLRPFAFAQNPEFCELEGAQIRCNDVMLPAAFDASSAYNPHKIRLWVVGHTYGAVHAVFAEHAQAALDELADCGALDFCQWADGDGNPDGGDCFSRLGNAGEPFDLSEVWMGEVVFEAARDIKLIVALARASEAGADYLE